MDWINQILNGVTWWGVLCFLLAPAAFGIALQLAVFDSTIGALRAAGLRKGEDLFTVRADLKFTLLVIALLGFIVYSVFKAF